MRFFKDCIKSKYLVLLFGLHVAAGCFHTWIAFHFYPNHGDIWQLFQDSIGMKQQLMIHPMQLAKDLTADEGFNLTNNSQSVLAIQYIILQYINVFLNFFSFDNLYVNTLLFSFPVFAGTVALYKGFYTFYNKPLPALSTLLLPSVLFWTSELYKDGVFYMATGLFLYYFLKPAKSLFLKGVLLFICFVLMILSRANALITLLPAVFFFVLSEKSHFKKISAITITIITTIITGFLINFFTTGGILIRICQRQKEFQSLTGGSRIYLPVPDPAIGSFIKNFPVAFVNGFFEPFPGVGGKLIYNAFSFELILIWILILTGCWLLFRNKTIRLSNFDIACLLFSLPGIIIIGYMVPFAGAIIRYRSIYLPFLFAPFINILCSYTLFQKINQWIYKNIYADKI